MLKRSEAKNMKSVAILGNMNNLGFIWMRYIRDLGYPVELFLFENDSSDGLQHFDPKNDTTNYQLYSESIYKTNIRNSLVSVSFLTELIYLLLKVRFNPLKLSAQYKKLFGFRKKISSADYVISMGIGPAFLYRFGKDVSLFYPYGLGVDNVGTDLIKQSIYSLNPFKSRLARFAQSVQIKALRKSDRNVVSDVGVNIKVMEKYDIPYVYDFLPLVYLEKDFADYDKVDDFVFFHHGRHYWVNDEGFDAETWQKRTKNTNLIIDGFKRFLELNPGTEARLRFVEYGKDFGKSKELVEKHGLEKYVDWCGLMGKNELLGSIKTSSVGIGEFYSTPDTHWGCAGWEILSMEKPLVQGGYFGEDNKQKYMSKGVFLANTAEEIANAMDVLYNDKSINMKMCKNAGEYYNGIHNKNHFLKFLADV